MHPEYDGALAQSVEQQTENLCVPGSIPGGTTKPAQTSGFFYCVLLSHITHITTHKGL